MTTSEKLTVMVESVRAILLIGVAYIVAILLSGVVGSLYSLFL